MLGSKLAPQTLCQPAQSKCMSQQLFMRKFAGKMPSPKVATHTLTPCSTLRSRNAHGQVTSNLQERCRAPRSRGKLCASLRHGAQEPFYVRIYRENAGGQTEHPYLTPAFYLQPLSVDTFGEKFAKSSDPVTWPSVHPPRSVRLPTPCRSASPERRAVPQCSFRPWGPKRNSLEQVPVTGFKNIKKTNHPIPSDPNQITSPTPKLCQIQIPFPSFAPW